MYVSSKQTNKQTNKQNKKPNQPTNQTTTNHDSNSETLGIHGLTQTICEISAAGIRKKNPASICRI